MLKPVVWFHQKEWRFLPIAFIVEMCSARGHQILLHCKHTGEIFFGCIDGMILDISHVVRWFKSLLITWWIQVPGSTTYSLALYYMMDTPLEKVPLLERFVNGDDAFRNSRFKLIPYISKVLVLHFEPYLTCFKPYSVNCRFSYDWSAFPFRDLGSLSRVWARKLA